MSNVRIPFLDLAAMLAPHRAALMSAAERVIDSGCFVLGPELAAFESSFAAESCTAHCIGVASGLDALELALRALEIGPGGRVGTVANAGGYSSAAIHAVGATPVYVDVDPGRLLLDTAAAAELIKDRAVDCLIVTHLYGLVVDLRELGPLCRAAGIPIIEDCAQAHGACLDGKPVGGLGDIGCFSFYPTKNLGALGDAGCCVCDDPELAVALRRLRNYGWNERYRIATAGSRNSRLDELQAAFLSVMFGQLVEANRARTEQLHYYMERLQSCRSITWLSRRPEDIVHLAVLRCHRRDALIAHLSAAGIGTGIHYPIADIDQPAWQGHPAVVIGDLRETRLACGEVLSIPCNPAVNRKQSEAIVAALISFESQA